MFKFDSSIPIFKFQIQKENSGNKFKHKLRNLLIKKRKLLQYTVDEFIEEQKVLNEIVKILLQKE